MHEIINRVRERLLQSTDENTQKNSQRFFKETIRFYGVKTAVVQKISKECFADIKHLPKAEIFALNETLWQSGMIEESFIACNWTYALRKQFQPDDFKLFRHWVDSYISNWASCDTFCNHSLAEFMEMYPDYVQELKTFTQSENRWMRRAAAVTFIIPARKGRFHTDIFEIADLLLLDTDDLVQKGYGWMLKAASQYDQQRVFEYVMQKKAVMPRTALRYAIEKMPRELRQEAMKK
ncbi:DNA alkylation repair protein [Maribellus luteus]|uniref:DNA alkylation repair protein n=1 Tax=Maribellus luteus TaxID=2305463 RepID=A0A399T0G7_9BACT|nr:DNA alkylation repair protein [Maribellus luteus]RIJ47691.1 DNA alkylation repair protein [Maribellus luteus]